MVASILYVNACCLSAFTLCLKPLHCGISKVEETGLEESTPASLALLF